MVLVCFVQSALHPPIQLYVSIDCQCASEFGARCWSHVLPVHCSSVAGSRTLIIVVPKSKKDLFSCKRYEPPSRRVLWSRTSIFFFYTFQLLLELWTTIFFQRFVFFLYNLSLSVVCDCGVCIVCYFFSRLCFSSVSLSYP